MTNLLPFATFLALAFIAASAWIVRPLVNRDVREHQQQVRQLKRNRVQQKIALRQMEIAVRQIKIDRQAAVHAHSWGPWNEGQVAEVYEEGVSRPCRRDLVQLRYCTTCNEAERKRTQGGGYK